MGSNSVRIVMIGAGGYAGFYINYLINNLSSQKYILCGVVDPSYMQASTYKILEEMNIPCYTNIESFYDNNTADLCIISSPIHFHKEQIIVAMQRGSQVLCEKPICPTIEEAMEIIELKSALNREVFVGFQMSYAEPILELKQIISQKRLGAIEKVKAIISWPRGWNYYSRNNWAGKVNTPDGYKVYDSVIGNATAHYLHNILFLLGKEINTAEELTGITAGLYRINDIETFDLCTFRGNLKQGGEVCFYTTHGSRVWIRPQLQMNFEGGIVNIDESTDYKIKVVFNNEEILWLNNPEEEVEEVRKIDKVIEWVSHRTFTMPPCTVETVLPCLKCTSQLIEKGEIIDFPKQFITKDELEKCSYVEGLEQDLMQCYMKEMLPYELGLYWAKQETEIELS